MDGIPPARDTDAEDVAWALQTAEALWKRNERGDAIVWLRRAAQAAGETNDDDRALALARGAAELTEWLARAPSASLPTIPPASERGATAAGEVDTLLRTSQVDPSELAPVSLSPDAVVSEATPSVHAVDRPKAGAPTTVAPVPPSPPTPPPDPATPPPAAAPAVQAAAPRAIPPPAPSRPSRAELPAVLPLRPSERVLSAAESHAGMLDPWSDAPPEPPLQAPRVSIRAKEPPPPPAQKEPPPQPAKKEPPVRTPVSFDDEVVTSAGPLAPSSMVDKSTAKTRERPTTPPPAKAQKPAPPKPKVAPPPPAKPTPSPSEVVSTVDPAAPSADAPADRGPLSIRPLDLSAVEAFADLPDDARDGLAKSARVKRYAKGEAIGRFALAFVLRGHAHVRGAGTKVLVTTLGQGAVLRGRGTLEAPIELELFGASDDALVAIWDDGAIEAALGSCPWVEEDLRGSADSVQAIAGASLGTLGQKLGAELRASIVGRLKMRAFAEHEVVVATGAPVPGILLVGAGAVELVQGDHVTSRVDAGQFVLPAEALSAGPSPMIARAAAGGALLLVADRKVTQELFATEPLLLELFAGW